MIHTAKHLATFSTGEAFRAAGLDLLVDSEVTRQSALFLELFVTGEACQAFHRVGFLVCSELQPGVQTGPAFGADVLAHVVLVPQVSGHVVGLTEGGGADRAAERFLLGVRPHVSGQFVWSPEAPPDTNGTGMVFRFRRGGFVFLLGAFTLRFTLLHVLVFRLDVDLHQRSTRVRASLSRIIITVASCDFSSSFL